MTNTDTNTMLSNRIGQLFFIEKEYGQSQRNQYAYEYFSADKRQSHQYDTDEERYSQSVDIVLLVGFINTPWNTAYHQEEIDDDTWIERHT